jgi:hypothetical protein
VPQPARQPTFLPLTMAATTAACAESPPLGCVWIVQRRAVEADIAAAHCWATLLADCNSVGRQALHLRLTALTEAAAMYVGRGWWLAEGSTHRHRVTAAQDRIEQAVCHGDGERFAAVFVGYDQAVATVVASVPERERRATG